MFEAARWAAVCGQLRCLKMAAALDERIFFLANPSNLESKSHLAHFAASSGHASILSYLGSRNSALFSIQDEVCCIFLVYSLDLG